MLKSIYCSKNVPRQETQILVFRVLTRKIILNIAIRKNYRWMLWLKVLKTEKCVNFMSEKNIKNRRSVRFIQIGMLCLIIRFVFCGFLYSQEVSLQGLAIDDVIKGLESFESQFDEMKCSYTCFTERTDVSVKINPSLGIGKLPPLSYDVAVENSGKISCKTYKFLNSKRVLEYWSIFDGKKGQAIQYLLDNSNGYTAIGTLNGRFDGKSVMPVNYPPLYLINCYARGAVSVSEFIKNGSPQGKLIKSTLSTVDLYDGDIICNVEVTIIEGNLTYKTTFTINVSKGF
ncbi:MAG: hypothetical protein LBJ67_04655 [Planctomycetaceae bacterium]|jgi:hypothetical protein|nr:hypothetical protein [Planctomycetaceae bacterium]